MNDKIDCDCTNEIICPYCGWEFSDSWEIEPDEEDIGLLYCEDCGEQFYASRNITIDYSTEKATKGTCKKCNKENVVIEGYWSSVGTYKDFCVECGEKEKDKLMQEYISKLEVQP